MHITLIGMSNIGKSHWAQKLATGSGFERIACDARIEEKLRPELEKHGYAGIQDLARWMGQPFDPQYRETSAKYMACERAVMLEATDKLKQGRNEKPLVIDTTGSVIYTGDDVAERLRALTHIVYLEASPAHMESLFERYLNNPKPVIWGDAYRPQAGEEPQDALKRCYPQFLHGRATRYKEIAHAVIPFEKHHAKDADIMSLIGVEAR